ncbi:MAG: hypothetical protein Hens3KO_20420 [Henriciella sp.]
MRLMSFVSLFMVTALVGCTVSMSDAQSVNASEADLASKPFITRQGHQLMNGDQPFRFLSINIPTLLYVEDEMTFTETNPIRLPNEFEIRDSLASARALGGQVVRSYSIPVRSNRLPSEADTYVEAPGQFNEVAFQTMDLVIALAAEYDLRLIIPLVNNWPWHGGRPDYAAFRGLEGDAFCTDPQLMEDFKATIDFVTQRVNTITGIAYKDDPTIMAWESGNEMTCPPEWAVEVMTYVKSRAPKQLTIDGWHAVHMPYDGEFISEFVQPHSINHPSIDIVSSHHYEENPIVMEQKMRETVALVDGKKPIFFGEFGFMSTSGMQQIMDYMIGEPEIAGAMTWSLRRHHRNGGWYYHTEPLGGGLYRSYHWPGFHDGEAYDERNLLSLLRDKAFEIQGLSAPSIGIPSAPKMLQTDSVGALRWQGAVGAERYTIERASTEEGPWQAIAHGVDDKVSPGFALYSDESAILGETYFYRVLAENSSGQSPPSNLIGPIIPTQLTRVDSAENFGVVSLWKDIEIKSDNFRKYKEATYRFSGTQGSSLVYTAPGRLIKMHVYAYEETEKPALSVFGSTDGEAWEALDISTTEYPWSEYGAEYPSPRLYELKLDSVDSGFVRLEFMDASDLVRVEIDYVPN